MAGIVTLCVIGGIFALILLFLFLKISLVIRYDGGAVLDLKILFFKIRLFPEKEKKHRKNPWYKRMAIHTKSFLRIPSFRKKSKKEDKKESGDKKKADATSIIETIKLVCVIVKALLSKLAKHLRIKLARINIKLATGDAASTAVAYGALTQSINVLFPLLDQVKNFSLPKGKDIDIQPDFLSEESEIDLRLVFSLRIWQIFSTAFSILFKIIKHSIKSLERKERKNHGN